MNTKQLRYKLIDLAMRGKLVPQDPADEPAMALLEQIDVEREKLTSGNKTRQKKRERALPQKENVPFEVPESWVWCRLGDICLDFQYGTSQKSDKEGKVAVLRMGNLQNGKLDYSDLAYTSDDSDIEKYALKPSELLFNRTNSPEWVGKTAIYRGEMPAIFAGYLIRISPIFIDPDYLNYIMNSEYHRDICTQAKTDGVNQSNINAQKLSNFIYPIPPLAEQIRIVKAVNAALAIIDDIEYAKADLASAAAAAKNKVLSLAINGKLIAHDSSDEPNKTLPLSTVCQLANTPENDHGILPYLDVRYLRTNKNPERKQSGRFIKSGTTVILVDGENSGEVFKVHEDGYMGSTFRELLIADTFDEKFVLLFIKFYQRQLRDNKKGSAIPHLNKRLFSELQIPIFTLDEQRRIVTAIEASFKHLDIIAANLN